MLTSWCAQLQLTSRRDRFIAFAKLVVLLFDAHSVVDVGSVVRQYLMPFTTHLSTEQPVCQFHNNYIQSYSPV